MLRPQTPDQVAFRHKVRDWFERELPAPLRDLSFRPDPADALSWYRKLAAQGWIAPHWPRSEGGMGAGAIEQVILFEEAARIGAPELPTQGLNQIGPILQRFGNLNQRARHLPPILQGDVIWCQGYSEPGSGSDLASLRTRGRNDGGEIVVSGHKIWTTWGHHADWMYALVRTDPEAPKREGISFVLIDLSSPGVTRRPILTIAGEPEFCEVFLDDVRVPVGNVVGHLGGGWRIATALLDQERILLGSPAHALRALERVRRAAATMASAIDPCHRTQVADAEMEAATVTAAYIRTVEEHEAGRPIDAASLKVLATEATQRILDILQGILGVAAVLKHPEAVEGRVLDFSELFLQSRRLSIYGGSNEIQRGLIATRSLQLPTGRG